ncbi:hypothetical protein IMZ48_02515, partial [Candidatus Bathyarchaeota archaeon]|nr:hypothetical protein [Candidatus Bathyarchaeota archaeon]
VSRSQSARNLTSSALSGIFSPLDPYLDDDDAPQPIRQDLDAHTYELLRERSRALRDRLEAGEADVTPARVALSLAARTGLLFLLGMGYGVLVARLRGAREESADALRWGYLAGWGVSGVGLGALLPWFDGVWGAFAGGKGGGKSAGADWSHVVRSIGAFVGIVFALVWSPFVWCPLLSASGNRLGTKC